MPVRGNPGEARGLEKEERLITGVAQRLSDIFTEPADVDPNTLANLGPLTRLAGRWRAEKGLDVSPKAGGPEHRVFIENIAFEAIDPQANGPQLFYGLRYHIHITTAEEDITFHDQVGYWLWEPATGLVLQTVALPRGMVALASGQAAADADQIIVSTGAGTDIAETTFLQQAFHTTSYRIAITFHGDDSWSYAIDTELAVRGKTGPFSHQDSNTLVRVGPATPNPWARIIASRKA